jgi:hypothetical protein
MPICISISSLNSFVIKGFKDLSRLKLTRLFLLFQDKRNRRRQKMRISYYIFLFTSKLLSKRIIQKIKYFLRVLTSKHEAYQHQVLP